MCSNRCQNYTHHIYLDSLFNRIKNMPIITLTMLNYICTYKVTRLYMQVSRLLQSADFISINNSRKNMEWNEEVIYKVQKLINKAVL